MGCRWRSCCGLRLGALQQNRDGLVGRRAAAVGRAVQRHQRVGLGVVGAEAAGRNVVFDQHEAADAAFDAVAPRRGNIHPLTGPQAQFLQIRRVDQQDVALAIDTAVAVIHGVDGGVVLVVRAYRREHHQTLAVALARPRDGRVALDGADDELRLAAGGLPDALARRHAQVKSTRLGHPLVVVLKAVDDLRDRVADARVVTHVPGPVHRPLAQRGLGHARHDGDLGQQIRRRRPVHAVRQVDHAHRVFHRDPLRHAILQVDFRAPQRGKDQRLLAVDEVAAVQLGADLHRQPTRAQRLPGSRRVRRGHGEIAAQPDEYPHLAAQHGVDRVDHVQAVMARRLEAEHLLQPVEERLRRFLLDPHGAVTLHVGVSAHRAQPRAALADLAAHHHQVRQDLDVGDRVLVLGQAHAPGRDHALAFGIDARQGLDLRARHTGFGDDLIPILGLQIGGEGVETRRVPRDEIHVEHPRLAAALRGQVEFEHMLGHALDQRVVPAQARADEHRTDPVVRQAQHVQRMLRARETLEPAFAQRVDRHDGRAALGAIAQLAHHAGVIRGRVLPEQQQRVGMLEIVECDGALADAHRPRKPAARRLVAHVGAVREIVGPVGPHEELEQEGRLVAGAPGRVERCLIRMPERVEVAGDDPERLAPCDLAVAVGRLVVHQGIGQAPMLFQRVVALFHEFGNRVRGEQIGGRALAGGLGGHGLDAVLAELEARRVVAVGPSAAWAVEAVRLVLLQQHPVVGARHLLLDQMHRHLFQGTPSGCCMGIGFDLARCFGSRHEVIQDVRQMRNAPRRMPGA